MELTVEQATALAPDGSMASAGRTLCQPRAWRDLGRDERAIWGECQGSALYQVRVDLTDLAVRCSCPSRKQPCKHAIGLLFMAASDTATLPVGTQPEWVRGSLQRRASQAAAREEKQQHPAGPKRAAASSGKRKDQRQARVLAGLDALDRWVDDLLCAGLGSVQTQPVKVWNTQAARLVDAQAPGLAGQLRQFGLLVNASPDWPSRLLTGLGRMALLGHAFRRLEMLDPLLQEDVRGAIGWSMGQEEVLAGDDTVANDWLVIGQRVSVEDRLRAQWTWLLALNDQGAPIYDERHAAVLAALGVPAFACTPDLFPDLIAAAIGRRDLQQWAAEQDIVTARAS